MLHKRCSQLFSSDTLTGWFDLFCPALNDCCDQLVSMSIIKSSSISSRSIPVSSFPTPAAALTSSQDLKRHHWASTLDQSTVSVIKMLPVRVLDLLLIYLMPKISLVVRSDAGIRISRMDDFLLFILFFYKTCLPPTRAPSLPICKSLFFISKFISSFKQGKKSPPAGMELVTVTSR